jgi:hypothetical protein
MSNTIQIKRSSTSGSAPTAGQLAQGELAVNLADEALYTKDASNAVVKLNAPSIDDKNTGATKQVTIDVSGNVGIGTSSPIANRRVTIQNAINSGTASTIYLATNYQNNLDTTGIDFGNVAGNPLAAIRQILTNNVNGASALAIYTSPDGTAPAERARIDSSGNLLVGVTSFSDDLNGTRLSGGTISIGSSVTTSRVRMEFNSSSLGTVGSISTNGSSTTYVTSSDYRLKHDIQPMAGALAKVAQLKPVTYKWNADDSQSQGFIAHELQEVVPECVIGEKDAVDAEGNPQYQGIDTSFLVATLVSAIQEQQQIITALTARVEALEAV